MSKPRKKKSSGKKLTKYEKVLLTTATLNLIKAHVLTGLICFIKTILPSGISDLDLINRSPAYYRYVKENPKEQTLAMLLGSVFHKLVLEPETFTAEYAVCPAVDRRTKAGKEAYQAFVNSLNDDVEVITDDAYKTAQSMAAAVKSHPIANKLLQGGQAESAWFWEENGVKCKCRPDYLRADIKCVIDLKTTQNASPHGAVKRV